MKTKIIIENNSEDRFFLFLTEEQLTFTKWLYSKCIISDYTVLKDEDWEEIK